MKNKKGFTLVELLAVIVILGVILVIAVPQVIDVIKNSKSDAWDDSVTLIKKAVELKVSLSDSTNTSTALSRLCKSSEDDTTTAFKEITDVGEIKISCTSQSPYTFTLRGTDKYKNKTVTMTCESNGKCQTSSN